MKLPGNEDRPIVMAFEGKHRLGPQATDGTLTLSGLIVVDNDTRTLAILPVEMTDPEVWRFCGERGWRCRGVVRLPSSASFRIPQEAEL